MRRAIRQVISGGSTDLHGGWLQGAATLAPLAREDITSRVILLSDGCANHGLIDPDQIYTQCGDLARAGVTTSTYGLGRNFNEDLMIGMARHGRGSSYYGQTADDLMDPFREEFELLNALCALRLRIPSATVSAPADQPIALGSVSIRYASLDGEPRAIQPQALALPALPAFAFQAVAEDELVAHRVDELEAAHLQTRARAAAQRGDWNGVERALKKAERIAANNLWVAATLQELRGLAASRDVVMFAKESAFASRRMSIRLAPAAESSSDFSADAAASYLRRKTNQGKSARPAPSRTHFAESASHRAAGAGLCRLPHRALGRRSTINGPAYT